MSQPPGHLASPSDPDADPSDPGVLPRQGTAASATSAPLQDLNLKQVARSLGVHYMTAYRYVRNGMLPARRHGQLWLVDPADLADFRRDRPASGNTPPVDWADRLRRRLLAGDEVGAWTVVSDALSAGRSPQACHLDLLARAMATLDSEVDSGRCALVDGHVAAVTAMRLVARLGATFRHRGRRRGTVVVGTPSRLGHGWAIAIVANLVRLDGFGVIELGTGAPPVAFLQSCTGVDDLVTIAVGVTRTESLPAAVEVVNAVHAVRADLPVLISGLGLVDGSVPHVPGSTVSVPGLAETILAITETSTRA